ncbi:DUF6187 family protein [Actinokineospora guangxiensis]|uniref:DUF6187 family protein n=1 Tax=Actinokineospora guangxiensis TaxID=1490288 RepID=A0ABW0EJ70_9PSEU
MSGPEVRSAERVDLRFEMPAVDDPPETEVGVILLGLDADRLLAGLGMAALAEDAGRIAVAVDRVRHGRPGPDTAALVAAGAQFWLRMRPALQRACPSPSRSASVRQAWNRAFGALGHEALGPVGTAARVYLTACWMRRSEVDALV